MSSFDADGYAVIPSLYNANKRRGRVHRDKHEGLWWRMRADLSLVFEYTTAQGLPEQRTVQLAAKTRAAAVKEYKTLVGKVVSGEVALPKGNARLDDAWAIRAADMKRWVAAGKFSAKTETTQTSNYVNHIRPSFGSMYLPDFGKQEIVDLFRDLTANGLAQWTQWGVKTALSHVLTVAMAEKWITVNPLTLVPSMDLPKPQTEATYVPRLFRNDELVRMFACCPDLYRQQLIVMAYTGLRIRELCGLTWDKINFTERVVYVHQQLDWDANTKTWGTQPPKGERTAVARKLASWRTVPMCEAVFDALAAQLTAERAKGYGNDGDWVFTSTARTGTPMSPDNLRVRGVQKAAANAVLGHVRPHDFRHTTASILASTGINDTIAAKMMGHTAATYRETYASAFEDAIERAQTIELLAGAGFGRELVLTPEEEL